MHFHVFSGKISHGDMTSVLTHMNWTRGQILAHISSLDRHAILCHICGQNHSCILHNLSVAPMCKCEHAWTKGGGTCITRALCISMEKTHPIVPPAPLRGVWGGLHTCQNSHGSSPYSPLSSPRGDPASPRSRQGGGSPFTGFSLFFFGNSRITLAPVRSGWTIHVNRGILLILSCLLAHKDPQVLLLACPPPTCVIFLLLGRITRP